MSAERTVLLPLDRLRADGGTQARAALVDAIAESYAEDLRGGAELPAAVAFEDGPDLWLADGFHTLDAHRRAGRKAIQVEVRSGTRREAILYAVGANAEHGLRRSREDERHAVRLLLSDPEWGQWSVAEIARRCKSHRDRVSAWKKEYLEEQKEARRRERAGNGQPAKLAHEEEEEPRVVYQRKGRRQSMRTTNLGRDEPELETDPKRREIEWQGFVRAERKQSRRAVRLGYTVAQLRKLCPADGFGEVPGVP